MPNPLPWKSADPNAGLGYRSIDASTEPASYQVTEVPLPPIAAMDAGPDAPAETSAGDVADASTGASE